MTAAGIPLLVQHGARLLGNGACRGEQKDTGAEQAERIHSEAPAQQAGLFPDGQGLVREMTAPAPLLRQISWMPMATPPSVGSCPLVRASPSSAFPSSTIEIPGSSSQPSTASKAAPRPAPRGDSAGFCRAMVVVPSSPTHFVMQRQSPGCAPPV